MKNYTIPYKDHLSLYIAFAYVLCDSLISYLLSSLMGFKILHLNSIVLLILMFTAAKLGVSKIIPSNNYILPLLLLFVALLIGGAMGSQSVLSVFAQPTSVVTAFIVGYACIANCRNERTFFKMLFATTFLYTLVCLLAILEIAPTIFPLIQKLKMLDGNLVYRKEVMTDPNIQIFYIMTAACLLIATKSTWKHSVLLVLIIANLFILSELQTRSGFVYMIFATAIGVFLLFREFNWKKRIVLSITIFLIAIPIMSANLHLILESLDMIILRFTADDFDTLDARTAGIEFFFTSLIDPRFWLPLNPDYHRQLYGYEPHFNPSALLLKGGVLAIICWITITLKPTLRNFFVTSFSKKNTSLLFRVISIAAFVALISAFSLPIPIMDQTWLWAGASIAVWRRESAIDRLKRSNVER